MLIATVLIAPVALFSGSLAHVTPRLLRDGLGVAVLSSALPYSLEMIALKEIPARTFGILMSLEPSIGALSGQLLLGEHLTTRQWLAVLLVMSASFGATITARGAAVAPEA